MAEDDLRRKATGSIGWILLERWSSRVVSLAIFAILARLLTPSDFGLAASVTVFVAVFQVFVDSGFSKALVQKKELDPFDAATAFWTSLGISVLLYVGLFFAAPYIAEFLGEPELSSLLQVAGVTLPIVALSRTPAALLEREFGFRALSVRQLAGVVAGAIVAIPMALLGAGVWAIVAQSVAATLVSLFALWASTSWRPSFSFSWVSLRALWGVGISILGIDLLDAIQANIDKFVIGALFSAEQLGYYFLAQRMGAILVDLMTTVISRVSLTTFSRAQDDLPRVNRIFRSLTFVSAAVGFPVFGLVAVLAPQLVPFVFGPGWDASILIIWILAPGWAFATVMFFDRGALIGTGHAATALWLSLVQNVLGIGLVFLFAPLGVIGVALSRPARVVTWPLRLFALRRAIGLKVPAYLSQVGRSFLAIVPLVVAIVALQGTPWATVAHPFWLFAVPVAVAAAAIYIGLLWVLAGVEGRSTLKALVGIITVRTRRPGKGPGDMPAQPD